MRSLQVLGRERKKEKKKRRGKKKENLPCSSEKRLNHLAAGGSGMSSPLFPGQSTGQIMFMFSCILPGYGFASIGFNITGCELASIYEPFRSYSIFPWAISTSPFYPYYVKYHFFSIEPWALDLDPCLYNLLQDISLEAERRNLVLCWSDIPE